MRSINYVTIRKYLKRSDDSSIASICLNTALFIFFFFISKLTIGYLIGLAYLCQLYIIDIRFASMIVLIKI